ncbi:MAG: hypothetical protein ACOCT9_00880 [archaeon]
MVCANCHRKLHEGIVEVKNFNYFNEDFNSYLRCLKGSFTEVDNYPICNKLKKKQNKFCSHKCANIGGRKINISKDELLDLMRSSSS